MKKVRSILQLVCIATAVAVLLSGCDKAQRVAGDSKPFPGYTLLLQIASRNTDLVDIEGRVVHRWTSKYGLANGARLLPNGDLIRSGVLENSPFPGLVPGVGGVIERFDWEGNLLWTFTHAESRRILHHDLEVLPNGNVLLMGLEIKDRQQQIDAGRDPARMRTDSLWVDYIIEVKPTGRSGGEIVWQWNVWDHLVQDHNPKVANFGVVGEHPERIDINFIETPVPISDSRLKLLQSLGYVGGAKSPASAAMQFPDSTHLNAITYNAQFDQIMLTSRSLGEIWVIDHGTATPQASGHSGGRYGHGGGILYRWGNPQASQLGTPADQKLFGPHDGQWIPPGRPGAGNILIFDNGDGRRDGEYSTIQEIHPPVAPDGSYPRKEGAVQDPAASEWRYVAEPKTSFFSSFLSGAQRLPNGNTLICVGVPAEVFEVDRAGHAVWRHKVNKDQPSIVQPGGFPLSGPKPSSPTGPAGPGGPGIPAPPLVTILDTNNDGSLDAGEISAAAARLLKLDGNGDGRVAIDECLPLPKGGRGGFPGPGGPGGSPPMGGSGTFPPGTPTGFPGGPPPPPLPPVFTVLDINGDRAIDASEISKAAESLAKLDADRNGVITMTEMIPSIPGRPGGPGMPSFPGPGGPPSFPNAGGGPGSLPSVPQIVTILEPARDGAIPAASIARASELLLKLDRNGDGKLSKNEYLPELPGSGNSSGDPPSPAAPPSVSPFVEILDINGDSEIDQQEIAQASALLAKLDGNHDGRISLDESLPAPPSLPGATGGPRPPGPLPSGPGVAAQGGLFRAVRFGLDFPGFKDRTLSPLPEK